MICTCVRIQTFSKWRIYILAPGTEILYQVPSVTPKNICAIKHENIIKRDYNVKVFYHYFNRDPIEFGRKCLKDAIFEI